MFNDILSLGGVMAAIVLVVNALKQFGIVKDGQAELVSKGLQAVVVLVLVVLDAYKVDLAVVDAIAQNVADLGVALLALVPILASLNGKIHDGAKGVPVIGYSYSLERAKHS